MSSRSAAYLTTHRQSARLTGWQALSAPACAQYARLSSDCGLLVRTPHLCGSCAAARSGCACSPRSLHHRSGRLLRVPPRMRTSRAPSPSSCRLPLQQCPAKRCRTPAPWRKQHSLGTGPGAWCLAQSPSAGRRRSNSGLLKDTSEFCTSATAQPQLPVRRRRLPVVLRQTFCDWSSLETELFKELVD